MALHVDHPLPQLLLPPTNLYFDVAFGLLYANRVLPVPSFLDIFTFYIESTIQSFVRFDNRPSPTDPITNAYVRNIR